MRDRGPAETGLAARKGFRKTWHFDFGDLSDKAHSEKIGHVYGPQRIGKCRADRFGSKDKLDGGSIAYKPNPATCSQRSHLLNPTSFQQKPAPGAPQHHLAGPSTRSKWHLNSRFVLLHGQPAILPVSDITTIISRAAKAEAFFVKHAKLKRRRHWHRYHFLRRRAAIRLLLGFLARWAVFICQRGQGMTLTLSFAS